MQLGLNINLSLNDYFPAAWVASELWPAELVTVMGTGNKCERVCVVIPVAESPTVYLIQLQESVFEIMCSC